MPGEEYTYAFPSTIKKVIINKGVTKICSFLFDGCKNLTSLEFPDSVTTIGGFAFSRCTGLKSVTLSKNLETIEGGAFEGCTGLTSLTLPENIKSIGIRAFQYCYGITELYVPASLTEVGESAFAGTSISSLVFSDNMTSITGFDGIETLENVVIPASVTQQSNTAFADCINLKSLVYQGDAPQMNGYLPQNLSYDYVTYYKVGAQGFTNPWRAYPAVGLEAIGDDVLTTDDDETKFFGNAE